MVTPTYDQLKAIAAKKGYKWFTAPYDLNVIGVRHSGQYANVFDDTICVAYIDTQGNKRVFIAPATVDPGQYYLRQPLSADGCAILPEGQYLSLWTLGKHKGYTALVQRKAIQVIRDNDRDGVPIGTLSKKVEIIGLNLHRALEAGIAAIVDKFSAGCQVVQVTQDFNYIIELVKLQVKYVKSSIVSYTLISDKEIK